MRNLPIEYPQEELLYEETHHFDHLLRFFRTRAVWSHLKLGVRAVRPQGVRAQMLD